MRRRGPRLLAFVVLLAAAAPAAAQHGHHEGGEPAAAVAAAWVEGSLCEADPPTPLVALGTHVGFAGNATHLALRAHGHRGFAAFGVATGEVVHVLIAMQEADVAIHALAAAVHADVLLAREGEAGIPTPTAPPPPGHEGMDHGMETQFAYDPDSALACVTPDGWLTVAVDKSAIPAGREWDVLAALDPLEDFLPHPIETTSNATFRLVAAMPGQDALALQAELDASAGKGGRDSPGLAIPALAGALTLAAFLLRLRKP